MQLIYLTNCFAPDIVGQRFLRLILGLQLFALVEDRSNLKKNHHELADYFIPGSKARFD